tara:strand:+ start:140 stop:295 length:156 start_codon:yes stop_codon:yes gene_type:complete
VSSQQDLVAVAVAVVHTTPIKKERELPLVEEVVAVQVFQPVQVVVQVLMQV